MIPENRDELIEFLYQRHSEIIGNLESESMKRDFIENTLISDVLLFMNSCRDGNTLLFIDKCLYGHIDQINHHRGYDMVDLILECGNFGSRTHFQTIQT